MKKIFKIVNYIKFVGFLKKLKIVDKSMVIEMQGSDLFCKVRSSDKSVVKYVSIPITDFLESTTEIPVPKRIKIGILDVNRLIDVFKYFDPKEELYLSIELSEKPDEMISGNLEFFTNSIKITFRSADITLLNYIEDSRQKLAHSTEDSLISLPINKEAFSKLALLSGMENNNQELLHLEFEENGMTIKGDSFSFRAIRKDQIQGKIDTDTYSIYKNQFFSVDQENSVLYIHENRIVIRSEESESIIAIGLVEL